MRKSLNIYSEMGMVVARMVFYMWGMVYRMLCSMWHHDEEEIYGMI